MDTPTASEDVVYMKQMIPPSRFAFFKQKFFLLSLLFLFFAAIAFLFTAPQNKNAVSSPTPSPSPQSVATTISPATAAPTRPAASVQMTLKNVETKDHKITGTLHIENTTATPVSDVFYFIKVTGSTDITPSSPSANMQVQQEILTFTSSQPFTVAEHSSHDFSFSMPYSADMPKGEYSLKTVLLDTDQQLVSSTDQPIALSGSNQYPVVYYNTCKIYVNDTQFDPTIGPLVKSSDKGIIQCLIKNTGKTAMTIYPTLTIAERFVLDFPYNSPTVKTDSTAITLAPNEEKTISMSIPFMSKPQVYEGLLSFIDNQKQNVSFYYTFRWTTPGPSAYIRDVELDKTAYKKGETAQLTISTNASMDLFWQGRGQDAGTMLKNPTIQIVLVSKDTVCGRVTIPMKQEKTTVEQKTSLSIQKDCMNPTVQTTIREDNGDILAQKSKNYLTDSTLPFIPFPVVVLLCISVFFFALTLISVFKKNNTLTSLLFILFYVGFLGILAFTVLFIQNSFSFKAFALTLTGNNVELSIYRRLHFTATDGSEPEVDEGSALSLEYVTISYNASSDTVDVFIKNLRTTTTNSCSNYPLSNAVIDVAIDGPMPDSLTYISTTNAGTIQGNTLTVQTFNGYSDISFKVKRNGTALWVGDHYFTMRISSYLRHGPYPVTTDPMVLMWDGGYSHAYSDSSSLEYKQADSPYFYYTTGNNCGASNGMAPCYAEYSYSWGGGGGVTDTPTPPPQEPFGCQALETNCSTFKGWACDPSDFNSPIQVDFWANPVGQPGNQSYVGWTMTDDVWDSESKRLCGYVDHGYFFTVPESWKDGITREIRAYALNIGAGSNQLLCNSPQTITCSAPSGSISCGSPCNISSASTTCSNSISWSTANTPSASVVVQETGATISSATSGSQSVVVNSSGYHYQLYSSQGTLLSSCHAYGVQQYSISGNVFIDTNRNCTQDGGESNYAGATVSRSGGGSTTTNGSGNYLFDNLLAGSYTISLASVPAGYQALCSTSQSASVGPNATGVNIPIHPLNSISGNVFVDYNRNCVQDGSDTAYAGSTLSLSGGPTSKAPTSSNGSGVYLFDQLFAGTYNVALSVPSAYQTFCATNKSFTVPADVNAPAGSFSISPSNISGTVFVDDNRDGVKQSSESFYSGGAPISLSGGSTSKPDTTTNGSGAYSFTNLLSGTYTVSLVSIPTGYVITPGTSVSSSITVPPDGTRNFGIVPVYCISGDPGCTEITPTPTVAPPTPTTGVGTPTVAPPTNTPTPTPPPPSLTTGTTVFIDQDLDSTYSSGDTPYVGAQLTLTGTLTYGNPTFPSQSTTTGSDGTYRFPDPPTAYLYAGTYTVSLTNPDPSRYTPSTATQGTVVLPPSLPGPSFGLIPKYQISGSIFDDVSKDGIKNGAESGMAGLQIRINGPTTTTVTTNSSGIYTTDTTLYEGQYTVTLISDIPDGYRMTNPTGGVGYPSFVVTVGRNCTVNSALGASCISAGLQFAASDVQNLNFGMSNCLPWFQLTGNSGRIDGSIFNDGTTHTGFSDPIPDTVTPACGGANATIAGGNSNQPGIIFSGGTPDFGLGSASTPQNWLVYPELYIPKIARTSYGYMTTTLRQSGITPIDLAGVCNLNSCNISTLDSGIYKADSSVIFTNTAIQLGKNIIILIDGDARITGNITVPSCSPLTLSTSGDITVTANVGNADGDFTSTTAHITGFFSTDQSFIIDSNGNKSCAAGATPDKRLNISGSVVVNAGKTGGSIQNRRDLGIGNKSCPAFTITVRPDFLVCAPEFIKFRSDVWREVAP